MWDDYDWSDTESIPPSPSSSVTSLSLAQTPPSSPSPSSSSSALNLEKLKNDVSLKVPVPSDVVRKGSVKRASRRKVEEMLRSSGIEEEEEEGEEKEVGGREDDLKILRNIGNAMDNRKTQQQAQHTKRPSISILQTKSQSQSSTSIASSYYHQLSPPPTPSSKTSSSQSRYSLQSFDSLIISPIPLPIPSPSSSSSPSSSPAPSPARTPSKLHKSRAQPHRHSAMVPLTSTRTSVPQPSVPIALPSASFLSTPASMLARYDNLEDGIARKEKSKSFWDVKGLGSVASGWMGASGIVGRVDGERRRRHERSWSEGGWWGSSK